MSLRHEQNVGTRKIAAGYAIDVERLQDYMWSHVAGFSGPLTVSQFKGGQSNPTYLVESPSGKYVLRRKPPGKLLPSAHAVDREFAVISALYAADFPVPRPICFCDDDEVVGTMFFIMEFVEGRIFWDLELPQVEKNERREIYDHVNQTIANLHNFDVARIGLSGYGKPGNYFARQISRWTQQYAASETATIDEMNELMKWLPENIPKDDRAAVVHGDFRLDNMIIHATEPRVIAVLDWELSTIGHPVGDFTYHLMSWQMPKIGASTSGLAGKDLDELGIPGEDEYVDLYCERTGLTRGIDNRAFYSAYNFFRLAAILQGIAGRVRDGTASSAHGESAAHVVAPLARLGWDYAKTAR